MYAWESHYYISNLRSAAGTFYDQLSKKAGLPVLGIASVSRYVVHMKVDYHVDFHLCSIELIIVVNVKLIIVSVTWSLCYEVCSSWEMKLMRKAEAGVLH